MELVSVESQLDVEAPSTQFPTTLVDPEAITLSSTVCVALSTPRPRSPRTDSLWSFYVTLSRTVVKV